MQTPRPSYRELNNFTSLTRLESLETHLHLPIRVSCNFAHLTWTGGFLQGLLRVFSRSLSTGSFNTKPSSKNKWGVFLDTGACFRTFPKSHQMTTLQSERIAPRREAPHRSPSGLLSLLDGMPLQQLCLHQCPVLLITVKLNSGRSPLQYHD